MRPTSCRIIGEVQAAGHTSLTAIAGQRQCQLGWGLAIGQNLSESECPPNLYAIPASRIDNQSAGWCGFGAIGPDKLRAGNQTLRPGV